MNFCSRFGQALAAILSATSIVSFPFVAQANDWVLMSSSAAQSGGARFFVDRDSIIHNKTNAQSSLFVIYQQPDDGLIGYFAVREFSCNDKKWRDLQTTYLKEDGSTRKVSGNDEWKVLKMPIAGTIAEQLFQGICNYYKN